jgi:hypothetical protein
MFTLSPDEETMGVKQGYGKVNVPYRVSGEDYLLYHYLAVLHVYDAIGQLFVSYYRRK